MNTTARQLHQARAVDTRRKLLIAAADVFDAKGFAATTISDIVNRAEATKGALYFHFTTKEDIARAIVAQQAEWVAGLPEDDIQPVQAVVNISYWLADALRLDTIMRASIRLTIEWGTFASPDPGAYVQWEDELEIRWARAVDKGMLRTGWTAGDAARLVAGAFTGYQLAAQVATDNRDDLPTRLTNFWTAVVPGLLTARGRRGLTIPPSPQWLAKTAPSRPSA